MANKFLNIKSSKNLDGNEYFYAERLGVDSIGFVLYDDSNHLPKFGLIREFKPPIQKSLITAFGGSLDDAKKSLEETLIQEVQEEAGFKVSRKNIIEVGRYFVSTQMNQFCQLYLIDVTNLKFSGRNPQNKTEEESEVVWRSALSINALEDWKAQIIINNFNKY